MSATQRGGTAHRIASDTPPHHDAAIDETTEDVAEVDA